MGSWHMSCSFPPPENNPGAERQLALDIARPSTTKAGLCLTTGPAIPGCHRANERHPHPLCDGGGAALAAGKNTRAELPVKGFAERFRSVLWLLALLPALAWLPGCGGDAYSETMVYPVRSDPLVTMVAGSKPVEFPEPDRPGQLPLLDMKDIQDSRNPYYKRDDVNYIDPRKLTRGDRQELEDVLQEVFGTPADPKVALISSEARQALDLHQETLKQGSQLYRLHCLQCHGLTGDGRGPTARWVNPHPRDYRLGKFKFLSVDNGNIEKGLLQQLLPRRDDLYRTIYQGVEGTAMQSYNMLPENNLNVLVSYVIHLSIRGQVEYELFKEATEKEENGKKELVFNPKKLPGGSITGFVKGKQNKLGKVFDLGEKWREAQMEVNRIVPGPYDVKDEDKSDLAQSSQRGYLTFLGKGPSPSDCATCHLDFGRKSPYKFDDWGTLVKPRDLTQSVYRGGRRPIDLYYRIKSGINGSGMPAHGTLTSDQIWDLVNFVRALPYPPMRKDLKPAIDAS
jgi:mono/diheme cytochrome c family protein